MVDPKRTRYLADSEGAPPVPPPGGYHGARRSTAPAALPPGAPVPPVLTATTPADKQPANAIGWISLAVAILFAVVLLGTMLGGLTDVIYGVTMLTLQLVVGGVVIAALFSKRGRMLGASALIVTLLFNTATVGAMSAVQTSASGNYDGAKTEEQKHEEAYPGIKDLSSSEILSQPSLEEIRADSEDALAEVRSRLSDRFGYTWTQVGDEDLRPERNGYGGESMLVQYTSPGWMTNEPIQDYNRKLAVMGVIEDVLVERGMYSMYSFNEPTSNVDESIVKKFYGTTDPRTQHTWEWYTGNYPDPELFYAMIYDLSNDSTGEFRAEREAQSQRTGEPLEGLQMFFMAPQVLSEDDVAEFEERMQEYPE